MTSLLPLEPGLRKIPLPEGFVWLPEHGDWRPDILVAAEPPSLDDHDSELAAPWISVLPIIGCGSPLGGTADVIASRDQASLAAALASLRDLVAREADLAWDRIIPGHTDLLAFLAVRNRALVPAADPSHPKVLGFREGTRFPDLERQAASLTEKGYLEVAHAETVNDCPACGSARLLVREVCSACGGSDVMDEAILHHFDCAWQGPEREFQDGPALQCPKCREALTTVGIDHDRPATVTRCRSCDHASQDPAVGFRCLDCGVQGRADTLIARKLCTYRLTEAGRRAVTRPGGDRDDQVSSSKAAAAS